MPADERLQLPNVTLVAVTSVACVATVRAMSICLEQIQFGDALLLSDQTLGIDVHREIRRVPIGPIRSRSEYSAFMLKELAGHINTDFALCVQWDGYVLNACSWRPEFLDYDYIGALWPQFDDGLRVGNGGFSLRSRRLLRAAAELPFVEGQPEDITICRTHRDWLQQERSIRFAPEDVASAFSYERYPSMGNEFGFHGVFNLANLIRADELESIILGLEIGLLAKREWRDLMKSAVKRGNFSLLRTLSRRKRSIGGWNRG